MLQHTANAVYNVFDISTVPLILPLKTLIRKQLCSACSMSYIKFYFALEFGGGMEVGMGT